MVHASASSRGLWTPCLDNLHMYRQDWGLAVDCLGISMPPSKSDLLQGTLDLLILQVVSLGPLHGYAIAQRLQQMSKDVLQVQQGSLYPALHRLEARGWLKAEWKASETGRDAKFYNLTRAGRRQLESERANWNRLAAAIGLVLRTAE